MECRVILQHNRSTDLSMLTVSADISVPKNAIANMVLESNITLIEIDYLYL